MEDPISKNLMSKAEPMMRRLGDKSNETNIQIKKMKNQVKKRKKKLLKPLVQLLLEPTQPLYLLNRNQKNLLKLLKSKLLKKN
jgi:hypothetical protein